MRVRYMKLRAKHHTQNSSSIINVHSPIEIPKEIFIRVQPQDEGKERNSTG